MPEVPQEQKLKLEAKQRTPLSSHVAFGSTCFILPYLSKIF